MIDNIRVEGHEEAAQLMEDLQEQAAQIDSAIAAISSRTAEHMRGVVTVDTTALQTSTYSKPAEGGYLIHPDAKNDNGIMYAIHEHNRHGESSFFESGWRFMNDEVDRLGNRFGNDSIGIGDNA